MKPNVPSKPANDTSDVIGSVLPKSNKPNSRPRAGVGGTFSHGSTCDCNPCKARRRQQETLAVAAGIGGAHLASGPTKTITTKTGVKKAAPKDLRARIAQFLHFSMMFPNAPRTELAEKMGITPKRLYEIITKGKNEGLIEFSDPLERLDYEIIPKIVDNLIYFLNAKDKTVTIEAAKGTLFPAYKESRGMSETSQTVLALKIELPDGNEIKVVGGGRIVGTPKALDEPFVDLDTETH